MTDEKRLRETVERYARLDANENLDCQAWGEAIAPSDILALLDRITSLSKEVERANGQLAGAEAANAATTAALVEHSELNGHIERVEECRDWIESEHIAEGGDTSGRLRDFSESLRIVIDQFDKQRRSRNWYEAAYTERDDAIRLLAKVVTGGNPTGAEWQRINELIRGQNQ